MLCHIEPCRSNAVPGWWACVGEQVRLPGHPGDICCRYGPTLRISARVGVVHLARCVVCRSQQYLCGRPCVSAPFSAALVLAARPTASLDWRACADMQQSVVMARRRMDACAVAAGISVQTNGRGTSAAVTRCAIATAHSKCVVSLPEAACDLMIERPVKQSVAVATMLRARAAAARNSV